MKPTVGRTVHFHAPSACTTAKTEDVYAAIVTKVWSGDIPSEGVDHVDLATLGPNSLYFQHMIPFSEEPKPGYWSWPPKV